MRRVHNAEFCINVASFHNWKDITLNSLSADILPMAFSVHGNLIDFVNKDDSGIFHPVFGDVYHLVAVHHVVKRLFGKNLSCFPYRNSAPFVPPPTIQYSGKILHA